MAPRGIEMGLVLALVTMLWAGAMAQSSCTSAIIGLAPCLNYITGNSSTPSSSCCSQLASVVQSQAQCLCTILGGGGSSLGLSINQTQALTLPAACNVRTPPVSQCNKAAGGPATSPAESPTETPDSPSAPSTPETPTVPSPTTPSTPYVPSVPNVPTGSGSKATPSTGGSPSNGNSPKSHISLLFFILFVASYASILTTF